MQKLLIKVVDELSSGLGTLARPWIIKRDSRAKAEAEVESCRIKLEALEDIRGSLRASRSGNSALSSSSEHTGSTNSSLPTELENTKQAYVEAIRASEGNLSKFVQIEREINLAQIAALAYEEAALDDDETCDDEPLDPDWFAKWRNYAQDVSKEEMQRLWARVLKGEAKTSSSFSIHTMDFLSRMSREDAEIIAKVNNFVLDGKYIFGGADEVLDANGVSIEDRMYLSDLGILTIATGLTPSLSYSFNQVDSKGSAYTTITSHDKVLIIWKKPEGPDSFSHGAYPVSTIGRELLQLAAGTHNIEYLRAIAEHVRDKSSGVSIGDVAVDKPAPQPIRNVTSF